MDTSLSDDQRLLHESAERFIAEQYPFERQRSYAASPAGMSEAVWHAFASMGWLGIAVPEEHGGLDRPVADVLVLAQALGPALIVEPWIPCAVLAAELTRTLAPEAAGADLLRRLARGEWRAAVATYEPESRFNLASVQTTARRVGTTYRLNGRKSAVHALPQAEDVLVVARTSGDVRNRDGLSLFHVPRLTCGLTMRPYETVSGARAADMELHDVEVECSHCWGGDGTALSGIERAVDIATAVLCAETVGALSGAVHLTAEYLRTRQQFGQIIGSFQALKHRMADMYIAEQRALSMITMLIQEFDSASDFERPRLVSAAKAQIGRVGKFIAQQAIQLHGGIGLADEYIAGQYLKRMTAFEATFGDTAWHLERYARG